MPSNVQEQFPIHLCRCVYTTIEFITETIMLPSFDQFYQNNYPYKEGLPSFQKSGFKVIETGGWVPVN